VHSNRSVDGVMPSARIARYCAHHNIRILAICDHDYLMPRRERILLERKYKIRIVPAVEYSTDCGDIIGIFVERKCCTHRCTEVLEDIKSQDGISVLPHPMRGHRLEKIPMELIDLVEIFNGRCTRLENALTAERNKEWQKIGIAGSDAHFPWELGSAINLLDLPAESNILEMDDEDLRRALISISIGRVKERAMARINSSLSAIVKGMKRKSMSDLLGPPLGILNGLKSRLAKK